MKNPINHNPTDVYPTVPAAISGLYNAVYQIGLAEKEAALPAKGSVFGKYFSDVARQDDNSTTKVKMDWYEGRTVEYAALLIGPGLLEMQDEEISTLIKNTSPLSPADVVKCRADALCDMRNNVNDMLLDPNNAVKYDESDKVVTLYFAQRIYQVDERTAAMFRGPSTSAQPDGRQTRGSSRRPARPARGTKEDIAVLNKYLDMTRAISISEYDPSSIGLSKKNAAIYDCLQKPWAKKLAA